MSVQAKVILFGVAFAALVIAYHVLLRWQHLKEGTSAPLRPTFKDRARRVRAYYALFRWPEYNPDPREEGKEILAFWAKLPSLPGKKELEDEAKRNIAANQLPSPLTVGTADFSRMSVTISRLLGYAERRNIV